MWKGLYAILDAHPFHLVRLLVGSIEFSHTSSVIDFCVDMATRHTSLQLSTL